ncbi:MAG: hypothetical protein H6895_03685 [Defluviimonas sp.]|uniref:hypothetical protein n=1 Tax=Albidovulum sp. TaxID=1872424 RepID=UPI001D1E8DEF|nr:hypothetical protein [Paracoccaceae bacterium]MCC0063173.1 hypothetical protein [Defluviimonas sp.]
MGSSHGFFVHLAEIGIPAALFGLAIALGDPIQARRHGAVMILPDVVVRRVAKIAGRLASKQVVPGSVRQEGFDLARFERALETFERQRT